MDKVFRTGPNIRVWDARTGGARTALDYAKQSSCDRRLADLFYSTGAFYKGGASFYKGGASYRGTGKSKGTGYTRASL